MSNEPGYPDRVCRGCSDKFISVEKHLAQLKEMSLSSYKMFNRKRAANSLTPTTGPVYVVSSDDLGVVPIDEAVRIPLDALGRPH